MIENFYFEFTLQLVDDSTSFGLNEVKGEYVMSHEEFLQEVLGKQVLQIIVDAVLFVRWTRLANAKYGETKMLILDA